MELYLMNINEIDEQSTAKVSFAFPKRYAHAMSYKNENDRLRSLAGSILLLKHIPGIAEADIIYGSYGKPLLKNGPFFSISHCGELVGLAVSGHPVGLDIQLMSEKNDKVIRHFSTPYDLEWSDNDTIKLHMLWTARESYVKMTGLGLSSIPRDMSIAELITDKITFRSCDGYMIAICTSD